MSWGFYCHIETFAIFGPRENIRISSGVKIFYYAIVDFRFSSKYPNLEIKPLYNFETHCLP